MLFDSNSTRIMLCATPTDMRKSFDGLAALTKNQLGENPLSGDLFVFVNKNRTYLKLLYFEPSGYCLWAKKLEQGKFHFEFTPEGKITMTSLQFKLMLEGWKESQFSKQKRYKSALENQP